MNDNFTTTEQSKILLDLGVPKDSADCYRIVSDLMETVPQILECSFSEKEEELSNPMYLRPRPIPIMPVWSSGRLLEIYCTAMEVDTTAFSIAFESLNFIEDLIRKIKLAKNWNKDFNFSKYDTDR